MCDRDKLMKLCNTKIENMHFVNSDHWFDFSQKIEELVDYLISNGVTVTNVGCKSEWINVEERLPDLDGSIRTWGELRIQPSVRVLCACKQKSGKVFVKEGYCELWGSNVVWKIPGSIDAVTHWMPLPDAPKGGAKL